MPGRGGRTSFDRCHGRSYGLVEIKAKGSIELVECIGLRERTVRSLHPAEHLH